MKHSFLDEVMPVVAGALFFAAFPILLPLAFLILGLMVLSQFMPEGIGAAILAMIAFVLIAVVAPQAFLIVFAYGLWRFLRFVVKEELRAYRRHYPPLS